MSSSLRAPPSSFSSTTTILCTTIVTAILLLLLPSPALSHGFLSTPRSRNLVAYEDRLYHGETPTTPFPEDCPTCINRGGTLARCGILRPGEGDERNYDFPQNAFGDPMPANPQEVYAEGSTIVVEVVLSAHHKGHFVFEACPVAFSSVSPTQACFDAHPLEFVRDELYGAPRDPSYPHRAYVAPEHHPRKVTSDKPGFERAMKFRFAMRLPPGLTGDLVLMQWYYVASNSGCAHEGYDEYPWPEDWMRDLDEDGGIGEWESMKSVGTGLRSCEDDGALPPDGEGVPEQFWNCAEVSIVPRGALPSAASSSSSASSSPEADNAQLQSDKTIIGYFASWQWYDRNKFAEPWVFDYRKYTRVNFAFFQTNEQGDLWGTDSWADPNLLFGPYNWNGIEGTDTEYCSWDTPDKKVCQFHHYEGGLLHLAKAAGAEVWPSIGGWSLSDPFPVMAANENARTNFANKCVELIEEYGFDGIDIDWEYPGYEAHSGTEDDTRTYNLLLQIVREKLDQLGERTGKFYGLTAALPCGTGHINNIDIPTAAKYLTELNLMTYDFFGAWSPTTGTNAPLYDQDWGGEDVVRYSVDGCVKNWVEGGGSPSAINIGLPFYGRGFMRAKHLNETHTGKPDKALWWQDEGSPQYFNIVEKLPKLVSVRHELTATQYAYNDAIVNGIEVGGMVSYDDEEAICDKADYCLEHDLNGFIIWEMSGDLMDDGTTPLIDAVHAKLRDPTLDCNLFAYDKNTFSGYATPYGNEVIASFARVEPSPVGDSATEQTGAESVAMDFGYDTECPAGFSDFKAGPNCTSYYRCNDGVVSPIVACKPGTLFDESLKICNHASNVQCTVASQPMSLASVEAVAAGDPTTDQPDPKWSGFEYETECPVGFSNFKAGPGCTSYYRCVNGVLVTPITPCSPGLLFDESLFICNFAQSVQCTITPQPTPQVTPRPTRHPITNEPTRHPITNKPTQSMVYEVPLRIPETSTPTRNPTPQLVTNQPSQKPIPEVTFSSPTPPYEVTQVEPNLMLAQVSKPTNQPTKNQQTPRPTRLRGNSIASIPTASSFAVMYPSETSVVEYNPNKGQEHIGEKIKNQIQQQKVTTNKAKMAKRGKKKGNSRQKKQKTKKKKQTKRQKKKKAKT